MIKFDQEYNVEEYTLILSRRNHKHIGQLRNVSGLVSKENFNAANEIAFKVTKYNNPENTNDIEKYWDDITDFKFIYVKELDEYYEITVEISDDQDGVYKSVTGTSACECELSQIYVYGLEVNTELDISREEYKEPTVFYKPENVKESLLHRILSVAPHYSIKYVDDSLKNIQRIFSCDGEDVYSFLTGEVANEIKCLFLFDTTDRSISVYDLETVCLDCGYRGEFNDVCPECGSKNLNYYGEDTTIYVDTENLADNVTFTTDTPSIKNCFKLEAGDDNMTAAVINNNPNGSQFIYYFSNEQKNDMSKELVSKLDEYDKLYNSFTEEYSKIMLDIYESIDKIVYYTSEMMPTRENEETDAKKEAAKLNEENLSPVGLPIVTSSTSTATVDSALKGYAKVFVHSGKYKIDINQGEFSYEGEDSEGYNYGYWYGSFKLTNWGDEEDTAISETVRILVRDNYQEFLEQKIKKKLANENDEEGSIFDVLSIKDLEAFKNALTYYGLNRLTSFYDALQGVIDILIEEDQASAGADMYEPIYLPYKNKLDATQLEIDKREKTIKTYEDKYDELEKRQLEIQKELNFQDYLGKELFDEFCCHRREDIYSNPNYISDGFENNEIFKRANEFLEVAKSELVKSGEHQHSISSTLLNLMAMKEFKPLINKFKLGNFIRVGVDNNKYKLRLLSYQITFDEMSNIDVEFSDLVKIKDSTTDLESILNKANSMASSYDYVVNQVENSQKQTDITKSWQKDGLDLTNMKIVSSAKNQSVIYDKNGLLVRSYDDIEDTYLPEQLKIVNSTIAITDDNWKSVKTAVGRFHYIDPLTGEKKTAYGINGEVLVGSLVLSERLLIKNNDETLQFNGNGLVLDSKHDINGQYNDIINLKVDGKSVFYINKTGDLVISPAAHLGDKGTIDDYINSLSQDFKTLNVILSNDLSTIPTDSNGNNGNYSSCTSSVQVFYGSSDVTKQSVITHQASTGVQYSVVDNTITVTNLTADSGYVEVTAAYDNGKIVAKKKFTIVKQKQGIQGQDGTPGSNGANGKTSYFHIKYSNKPNPTVSSDITEIPSTYIGTYVDFTEADSTDPKKYTWSRFEGQKGENGIAGVNGIDGKTSYLHIAYANSQDGSVGFSVTDSANKLYIGQYTDFVLQDSVDYKRYSWTKIKGNDGLNGTNGQNAILYQIISSTNVIKLTQNNVLQPANVTFNSVSRVGNSTSTTPFAGRFKIEESLNGSSYTTKYTSSANESTKVWTPSSKDVVSIRCSLYMPDGKTLVDMQSVTILTDISQLTQKIVFDKLTDNGRLQGLFMQDNKLYINASYLSTGIITDKNGKFSLNMETGKAILNDGEFKGKITSTNGVIGGWDIQQGKLISYADTNNTNYLELDSNNTSINFKKDKKSSTWNTEGIYFVDKSGSDNTHTETETLSLKYGNIFIDYQWEDNDPGGYHTMGGDTATLMHGALQFEDPYHGLLSKFSLTTLLFEGGGGYKTIFINGEDGSIKADEVITKSLQGTLITGKGSLYYLSTDVEIGCGSSGYENNAYVQAYNGYCSIRSHSQSVYNSGAYIDSGWSHGKFYPQNAGQALGTSAASNRWYRLYAANACNTSSDRRLKKDIAYFDEMPAIYSTGASVFEEFFNKLRGTTFVAKGDEFNRIKFGFIAQDVIDALQTVGLTAYDVDFVSHGRDENDKISEDAMYGLCYEEFIALNTHMIQKALKKIDEQQKEIDDLKKRLSTIENSKL